MKVGRGDDPKHADHIDVYWSKLHTEAREKIPVCIVEGSVCVCFGRGVAERVNIKNTLY